MAKFLDAENPLHLESRYWETLVASRNSRTRLPMSTVLVLPATYRIAISSLRHGRKPAVGAAL